MTGRPALPWRRGRDLTLRQFLQLLVIGGVLYVATIALFITLRIAPTARALQGHSELVLAAHDQIRASMGRMDASAALARGVVDRPGAASTDSIRALSARIRSSLDSIALIETAERLAGVPSQVREALATAAQDESSAGISLLEALANLELGRPADAAGAMRAAAASRSRAEDMLRTAERAALADLVSREARLGEAATLAGHAVIWWLLVGVALLPVLVLFMRRRVYRPLARLESALGEVASGDLDTVVENPRDDEIGRLGRIFNTMTGVIRQRREEERQAGRDALRESEERYRAAFENAALGMAELSPEGRYLRVNAAFCRLLDYLPEELLARTSADITHAEDRPRDAVLRAGVESGEHRMYRHEKRLMKKDGSLVWVVVTVAPVRNRDGRIAYWVGICEDMTERRSLQKQLAESQRLESIGRLAGGVAHDFNNLLTAVLGNRELAMTYLSDDHPAAPFLEEIDRAGMRAAELTRQLLAFARRQVVEPKVVDLNKLTRDMDRLLRRVIGEHVDLVTNLDPTLGATKVDATQFEQVIVNLAVNARDAMPHGGKLTLETRNVELDEAYAALHSDAKPGRYVMMAVSDNGIGMDETTRAHIFEPFFTTKERTKGTGLGLATVYGIVHQAGGHIWVYSEPGRGATFKVYLPRTDEAIEAAAPRAAHRPAPRGNETVLLVEDEWQVRDLLATGLTAQGYTVITASDGQEALDKAAAATWPIDILVTDVVLPVLSGREVAARLAVTMPKLPVLFMSGYAEDAIVHQGVVDAGVAFLSKPFTVADLGRRIRSILEQVPASGS